jgi:hypothetical protein
MAATRSFPGGLRSAPPGAESRAPDERVEHSVTGNPADLARCLQDAAPPAGSTVLSDAPVRRCDLTRWTVEELLPLVGKGRAPPWRSPGSGRYQPMPSSA